MPHNARRSVRTSVQKRWFGPLPREVMPPFRSVGFAAGC
jgi:hypothetical protein